MQPLTPEKALERLENMCSRAEHAEGEVREKLRRWGVSAADSEKIIASLRKHRFIDQERFVAAYVNDKVKFAHWGRRKIRYGLIQKRVDSQLIDRALSEIDETLYRENLQHLISTKFGASPTLAETFEGRTKVYRSIISRGYEPSLVSEMLKAEIRRGTAQAD